MINAFCIPGGHAGPKVADKPTEKAKLTLGWRMVRASFDKVKGEWFYDPDSLAQVCCCPLHSVRGEPNN